MKQRVNRVISVIFVIAILLSTLQLPVNAAGFELEGSYSSKLILSTNNENIFTIRNAAPGLSWTSDITILNSHKKPLLLSIAEIVNENQYDALANALLMQIRTDEEVLYTGPYMITSPIEGIEVPANNSMVLHVTIELPASADNSLQGMVTNSKWYFDIQTDGISHKNSDKSKGSTDSTWAVDNVISALRNNNTYVVKCYCNGSLIYQTEIKSGNRFSIDAPQIAGYVPQYSSKSILWVNPSDGITFEYKKISNISDGGSAVTIGGKLIDDNGNTVGYITSDRRLIDNNGGTLGYIQSDGTITDDNGNIVAHIEAGGTVVLGKPEVQREPNTVYTDGVIVGSDGNTVGIIQSDGSSVADTEGNIIGFVDNNNNVIYNNGMYAGHISSNGTFIDSLKGSTFIGYLSPNIHITNSAILADEYGNVVGSIARNGNLIGLDGTKVGAVTYGGSIIDIFGTKIGYIDTNSQAYNEIVFGTDTDEGVTSFGTPGGLLNGEYGRSLASDNQWLSDIIKQSSGGNSTNTKRVYNPTSGNSSSGGQTKLGTLVPVKGASENNDIDLNKSMNTDLFDENGVWIGGDTSVGIKEHEDNTFGTNGGTEGTGNKGNEKKDSGYAHGDSGKDSFLSKYGSQWLWWIIPLTVLLLLIVILILVKRSSDDEDNNSENS